MDYLKSLNKSQNEAVNNLEGAMMVIAGAGSGKTRVLTFRIANLIQNDVDPFNILALTFTNKAAKEMKKRIGEIIGDQEARNIWMGTFHSIFARILRIECEKIGYPKNFTIYDTQDSKSLIKTIVKEFHLDDKLYKPGIVYNRISSAKNNLISATAYTKNTDIIADDRMNNRPKLGEIYMEYQKRCFKSHAMDFDDLLFKTNVLLKDHADALHRYQHKFKYILVDEYQDTNYSQYLIVKRLAALNENLCVVGDDAQSIYAFRGANIQNILNFKKDYPDFKLFKLEQNYRSTKVIVEAANSIISNNTEQIEKKVWTANSEGDKIKVFKAATDNEEGKIVANSIFDNQQQEHAKNLDFAILYRTNAQSRSFEESLRKLNIAYKIYGGLSFYQRKEIKDILAYYRLTTNHNDEEALKRVINYPKRGIGKTSLEHAMVAARQNGKSLWHILDNPGKYPLSINNGAKSKIKDFIAMIKSFAANLEELNAYDIAHQIASSCGLLKELYTDKTPEGISRYENIQELLNGIKEFSDNASDNEVRFLADFLLDVALLTDADNDKPEDQDKVTLMTIHAAKGLEFPYVYIVGLEENLFPSQLSLNTRAELEEERRLFYVAMTRAEKKAFISFASSRYKWGNVIQCEPSRFIEEIDEKFLDLSENKFKPKSASQDLPFANSTRFLGKSKKTQTTVQKPIISNHLKKVSNQPGASVDIEKITEGVNVSHARFGKGKVIKLEGSPPNVKATVFFPNAGQKQLLLKFAKLDVLD
ncbi:UvrD-helicase domain-containing protein [Flavobacteriales bacterium]|nr:UvrD-helicase domain-containing protein [Flavobacteriales bacterium]MDC3336717.1 UvrD-helicase domain-containing protein [Flavobacteriales bacterium]